MRTDGISFTGKQEIIYGIKKAAGIARQMELQDKAYTRLRFFSSKDTEKAVNKAKLDAYLDMVTKDGDFANAIWELSQKDLRQSRNLLMEKQTEHGIIKPFDVFVSAMKDVMSRNKTDSKENKNILDILLYKLK